MPVPRTSSKIVDRTGRRLLPIGSEDFTEVVTEHVYVDKTSLIRNSRLYFLPHGSGISTGHVAPMAL